MTDVSEIERRLTEIHNDVRELKGLVVGTNGDEGTLVRLAKLEQKHGFLMTCYLWLAAGMVALLAMVVPSYFSVNQK